MGLSKPSRMAANCQNSLRIKVDEKSILTSVIYASSNAWQCLAMLCNSWQFLAILGNAWHKVTYPRSWNKFTFILVNLDILL